MIGHPGTLFFAIHPTAVLSLAVLLEAVAFFGHFTGRRCIDWIALIALLVPSQNLNRPFRDVLK